MLHLESKTKKLIMIAGVDRRRRAPTDWAIGEKVKGERREALYPTFSEINCHLVRTDLQQRTHYVR